MSKIIDLEFNEQNNAPIQLLTASARPDWAALCIRNFFPPAQCDELVKTFYSNRAVWSSHYNDEQFSIGEVWYVHHDVGTVQDYANLAEQSIRRVEGIFPGLYARLLGLCRYLCGGEPVRIRKGWAGPGIVIFPSAQRTSNIGGIVHFDWDGLSEQELACETTFAFSLISMWQKPVAGGDLRVWPVYFDPQRSDICKAYELTPPAETPFIVQYEPGAMVVIPSLKMHQISPFEGGRDRICLTFHIARRHGSWDVWF
jgi:hypothetical protein